MRIDIMTLFPELVDTVLSESIIGRARAAGILDIRTYNIRDYSTNKHHRVDDTPCGGGKGMLMASPPILNCYNAVLADSDDTITDDLQVVYMSPRGKTLCQTDAKRFSEKKRLIILCGHYEGVDERAIELINAEEISIGDYVLTGGEIPACILTDAVGRLVPGVLSEAECHEKESFEDDLLEYPQYTRPVEFMGKIVPEVLLSGHHANIEKWRIEQSEIITEKRRPDMYCRYKQKKDAESALKKKKSSRKKAEKKDLPI